MSASRRAAQLALLALSAVGAAPDARPAACDRMVECPLNDTKPAHSKPRPVCPGIPACSGHGRCIDAKNDGTPNCRCDSGYFGRDCARKERDCAKLRSCADCQHPANTKFCGWCAQGRYCLPKHVHRTMAKRGKACSAWHEDDCPAHNHTRTSTPDEDEGPPGERGDDMTVALAEALVAMIDEAGGEGTSTWLGYWLLALGILGGVWCSVREKRAAERKRRYAAFMAEEMEMLHGRDAPFDARSPSGKLAGSGGRQLGPWASEPRGAKGTDSLASALASVPLSPLGCSDAPSGGSGGACRSDGFAQGRPAVARAAGRVTVPLPDSCARADNARPGDDGTPPVPGAQAASAGRRDSCQDELPAIPTHPAGGGGVGVDAPVATELSAEAAKRNEDALRDAVRTAARRDIEERKQQRRLQAEDARESALVAERAAAELAVRQKLQCQTQLALAATAAAAAVVGGQDSPCAQPFAEGDSAASDVPAAQSASAVGPVAEATPEVAAPAAVPPQLPTEPLRATAAAAAATDTAITATAGSVPLAAVAAVEAERAALASAEAEFLAALDDL